MDVVREIVALEFGVAPQRVRRENGGSINECFVAHVPDRAPVFIKVNDDEAMFQAEREGLRALHAVGALRVPDVLHVGRVGNAAYLVMEYVPMASSSHDASAYAALGDALARQHAAKQPDGAPGFGFHVNNVIGLTPQINTWSDNWVAFFARRLQFQVDLLRAADADVDADPAFLKRVALVIERVDAFFDPDEEIAPSLLHGDLWHGNWGFAETNGEPVVFDPATYYGHSEADLATLTLFGAVPSALFAAYFQRMPKARRFDDRVPLYQLYHALNHYNLFGSAYKGMCEALLKPLLAALGQ